MPDFSDWALFTGATEEFLSKSNGMIRQIHLVYGLKKSVFHTIQ